MKYRCQCDDSVSSSRAVVVVIGIFKLLCVVLTNIGRKRIRRNIHRTPCEYDGTILLPVHPEINMLIVSAVNICMFVQSSCYS